MKPSALWALFFHTWEAWRGEGADARNILCSVESTGNSTSTPSITTALSRGLPWPIALRQACRRGCHPVRRGKSLSVASLCACSGLLAFRALLDRRLTNKKLRPLLFPPTCLEKPPNNSRPASDKGQHYQMLNACDRDRSSERRNSREGRTVYSTVTTAVPRRDLLQTLNNSLVLLDLHHHAPGASRQVSPAFFATIRKRGLDKNRLDDPGNTQGSHRAF